MRRTDLSRDQRHGRDVCGGDGACRALTQGVSGAGKSTVGVQLAEVLGAPFLDADEYHSAESIAKLASGTPLTDDDRWPWLARVAAAAREHAEAAAPTHTCVVACSALKVAYRDALRATRGVRFRFVYLRLAPALLAERLAQRAGHFMRAVMLSSQLETLEEPRADEAGACVVNIVADMPRAAVVRAVEHALQGLG